MMGLNSTMLKTLAITADGKCVKHPHMKLLCSPTSPTATHPPTLQECECCWKEQQERKNQSSAELTTTSVSISPSDLASVAPPPLLQAVTSTTLPSGTSKSSEAAKRQAEWSDTVMMRWNQVQDIGIGGGGSGGSMSLSLSEEATTSLSMPLNQKSSHGVIGLNPANIVNMSMAVVTEEPDDRTSARSRVSHSHRTAQHHQHQQQPTSPPWSRLEERVQRQEEAIEKLQETVQRQEASIRNDLQQLMQMVSNLATNTNTMQKPQELTPRRNYGDIDITVGVLETPIAASNPTTDLPLDDTIAPPGTSEATSQRPGLYKITDHHPANIFTSVRTIERKPPKPPMRHGSFSTNADSRRLSVGSATHMNSIISSLGNSTLNDTATYNDTTAETNITIASPTSPRRNVATSSDNNTSSKEEEVDNDPDESPGYGPGVHSLLETARCKPLEIIFDASGIISMDTNLEESRHQLKDENDNEEGEEEKKNDGVRSSSPLESLLNTTSSFEMRRRDSLSFEKSSGSRRLTGRSKEIEVNLSKASSGSRSRSCSPKPPARLQRKVTPPFESGCRPNRPMRQPRRELSVADVNTEKAENRSPPRKASPRERSSPPSRTDVYVPPPAPPSAPGHLRGSEQLTSRQSTLGRLHPSNLSRLGVNTAPPRREIFATGNSKLQISCLTIDTALVNNDSEHHMHANGAMNYREVNSFPVTDKFGDRGVYTGTLREAEVEEEGETRASKTKNLSLIPHGTGTMKYEEGRFYEGQWRDGHWHGKGLLKNANGDSYEGEFVYDARHGRGIYKYENGDVYEGDFTEDKRHGKGTFLFHNGSIFRGDFVNGDFEGYGWYEFDDGWFEGEWKGGAYHGIGSLQYTDGGSYTGRFFEGKAHGHGEERDADGTVRRGNWIKGALSES